MSFERYIARDQYRVQGWLAPESARLIASLADYQTKNLPRGAVGEIGVHHGRLFILLALVAPQSAKFVIDVFGEQQLNLDASGHGDRAVFEANLRREGIDPADVTIFSKSSLEVTGAQVREAVGPVALLSIDGGHTVECIQNDLRIAEEAMDSHGVAILDDVFNATWPSVMTGFAGYLQGTPGLVPFAASPNKVYVCRPEWSDSYRQALRAVHQADYDRSDALFGFEMDTYGAWKPHRVRLSDRIVRGVRRRLGA
jgi:hypothetical protein